MQGTCAERYRVSAAAGTAHGGDLASTSTPTPNLLQCFRFHTTTDYNQHIRTYCHASASTSTARGSDLAFTSTTLERSNKETDQPNSRKGAAVMNAHPNQVHSRPQNALAE